MDDQANEEDGAQEADFGDRLMAEMGWWDLIDRFVVASACSSLCIV